MQDLITAVETPTFELALHDRQYPAETRPEATHIRWLPDQLIPRMPPNSEQTGIPQSSVAAQTVFDSLWKSLPIAQASRTDFEAAKDVVRCVSDSHSALTQASEDLHRLFRSMCVWKLKSQRHPELDEQLQDEIEAEHIDRCLDREFPYPLMSPKFRAANVVGDPAEIFDRFHSELHSATGGFVESIFSLLDDFVGDELVGLIKWPASDTCHFYSYHSRVTHEVQSIQRKSTNERREIKQHNRELPFPYAKLIQEKKKDVTTKHGRHIFERVRHDQHLVDAEAHEWDDPDVVIPHEIWVHFSYAVPDWMEPALRIVTGDCFRELFIRRQERVQKSRQDIVTESVDYHFCPAIVLGDFVLVAWGAKEHEAEVQRRKEIDDRKRAGRRAIWLENAGGFINLIGTCCLIAGLRQYEQFVRPGQAILLLGFLLYNFSIFNDLKSLARAATVKLYVLKNLSQMLLQMSFLGIIIFKPSTPVIACCMGLGCLVGSVLLLHKCERLLGRNPFRATFGGWKK